METTRLSYPVLTDDELIALVMDTGSAEPLLLPTVDVDDETEVLGASLRGQRSLAVRMLYDENGDRTGLLDQAVQLLAGDGPRLSIFLGDREFHRRSFLMTTVWRPTQTGWLEQNVSPVGTHAFREIGLDQLESHLVETFDEGGANVAALATDPPVYLCLALVDESGVRAVGVSGSDVVTTRRGVDGNDLGEFAAGLSLRETVTLLVRESLVLQ